MRTIAEIIRDHPFFDGFGEDTLALLAGCARNLHLRPGQALFREGEGADAFYVVRSGRVSVQIHRPAGGPVIVDTVEADEVVGWSWLVEPPRWSFDAVAALESSVVQFDATCLRDKCDADPAVGYLFMRHVGQVMADRLKSARTQLLDVYASGR
ncbi:cyclic nucleotide-binding domain-containing protein [Intrasporangium sp. DVR]|uniref:cyclic nucleotide-binding domain-containing protein n=1 Tax=Intrasporangium sp. DVR TaxID=3127867 RepID=UPI00313A4DBC